MNVTSLQGNIDYFKSMQQFKEMRAAMDESRLASIQSTLMLGKKLSADEMGYLQRNHPHIYQLATKISVERRSYEDILQQSRSKANANGYTDLKLLQIAGQLKHGNSEELLMRANAIQEAHREFMRSSKYASLK